MRTSVAFRRLKAVTMNLIRATGKLLLNSKSFKSRPSVRGAIYLDRDWMPGPYPKTESERLAAAKKYNLLPEEYQAYDPEKWEFAYGDYPQLPNRTPHDQDPYYAWDYYAYSKNYGEPYHINTEIYSAWGRPLDPPGNVSFHEVVLSYFVACGLMFAYCYWNYFYFEDITVFKHPHRIYPGETYYHYPNSKLEYYEW